MSNNNITQDTFTLEDLDAAGKRLHINTILVFFINGFCSYLIIFYSTKAMKEYKNFLLLTIISSTIMDTHFSFIWGPIPTPPFPGVCSAGFIGSRLGHFWGEVFQHG
uniref:Uncharacterized protein n=1 Tax=Panagrolaimus davidi TaxID=227884 RepID=A0A914PA94_9BILA